MKNGIFTRSLCLLMCSLHFLRRGEHSMGIGAWVQTYNRRNQKRQAKKDLNDSLSTCPFTHAHVPYATLK